MNLIMRFMKNQVANLVDARLKGQVCLASSGSFKLRQYAKGGEPHHTLCGCLGITGQYMYFVPRVLSM